MGLDGRDMKWLMLLQYYGLQPCFMVFTIAGSWLLCASCVKTAFIMTGSVEEVHVFTPNEAVWGLMLFFVIVGGAMFTKPRHRFLTGGTSVISLSPPPEGRAYILDEDGSVAYYDDGV